MINRKLQIAMFAATGLLPAAAQADFHAPQVAKIIAQSPTDFAPITSPNGTTPGRLRRTDQEQAGNEMTHMAFFKDPTTGQIPAKADGSVISGLYFSVNTDLVDPAAPTVSNLATDRVQLALVPIALMQNPDGTVTVKPVMTGLGSNTATTGGARFVTANQGEERRNANHPIAYAVNGGNVICAEYNARINGANNTERYAQCFSSTGATLMPQTRIYAKNNDDCSMNQDANNSTVAASANGVTRVVSWMGCNGNGQDDGWAQVKTYTADSATNPTKVTFKQLADVSLCPREERSRGLCTVGTDANTAICTWTEGNTQPQRDGTWMAAIDISGSKTGQAMIYWKQQIDGRKTLQLSAGKTARTYSMRAMQSRVLDATGKPTDMVIFRAGDVMGNNNDNNKGGTYYGNNLAVIKATAAGMSYVVPLTDMSNVFAQGGGLDGTHLGMSFIQTGTADKPVPGIMLLSGSHTGGGYAAQAKVVSWDQTANKVVDGGSFAGASYDRHLYSNYLGNNPGNQGRNFAGSDLIENPFAGTTPGADKFLMVMATSGKDSSSQPSATCLDCAKIKLTAYVTVIPVAQNPQTATGGGSGMGSGGGSGMGSGGGTGMGSGSGSGSGTTDPGAASDPGTTLGGCSTGSAGGGATLLLIGLAAFRRRRR